jgi:hypothetical protein
MHRVFLLLSLLLLLSLPALWMNLPPTIKWHLT